MKNMVNSILKFSLLAFAVIGLWSTQYSLANSNDGGGIAVLVNDDVISTIDVQERLEQAIHSSGLPATPEIFQKLLPQIIRVLIDEKLYLQEAQRLNITIKESEVERAIASIEQQRSIPKGKFDHFLQQQNLSKEGMIEQLRAQIAWQKIVSSRIQPSINVSEEDVDQILEQPANHEDLLQYHLSEIVLPITQGSEEKEIKELALRLVNEIKSGASFSAIAKQFSRSPSANSGGDIGWINQNQLSEEFIAALASLPLQDVTSAIRMPEGYYILQLHNKKLLSNQDALADYVLLKQIFLPLNRQHSKKQIQSNISMLEKTISQIESCADFGTLGNSPIAEAVSEQYTQVSAIPTSLQSTVLSLPVGKVSNILRSELGLHALMVCERLRNTSNSNSGKKHSIQEREQVYQSLLQQKIELSAKQYLRKMHQDAFIEFRL